MASDDEPLKIGDQPLDHVLSWLDGSRRRSNPAGIDGNPFDRLVWQEYRHGHRCYVGNHILEVAGLDERWSVWVHGEAMYSYPRVGMRGLDREKACKVAVALLIQGLLRRGVTSVSEGIRKVASLASVAIESGYLIASQWQRTPADMWHVWPASFELADRLGMTYSFEDRNLDCVVLHLALHGFGFQLFNHGKA